MEDASRGKVEGKIEEEVIEEVSDGGQEVYLRHRPSKDPAPKR